MVQSLGRGIAILEYLASRRSAGCTEVAQELGVNKSSAFRLLETLQASNFVEQDDVTGKYRLGPAVLHLSESLLKNLDLVSVSKPHLIKLMEKTQESAHLCLLSNNQALIVDQIKSQEVMKVSASIGMAEDLHCSAVGKCLLAFRNDVQRERMLNRTEMKAHTARTLTSVGLLRQELAKIRETGYSLDDEEINVGVRCIAAPIWNHKGEVLSCIGISGPASRIRPELTDKYAVMVKDTASQISARIGYQPS